MQPAAGEQLAETPPVCRVSCWSGGSWTRAGGVQGRRAGAAPGAEGVMESGTGRGRSGTRTDRVRVARPGPWQGRRVRRGRNTPALPRPADVA